MQRVRRCGSICCSPGAPFGFADSETLSRKSDRTTENGPARSGPPTSPFTDAVPKRPAFLRRVRAEGCAKGLGQRSVRPPHIRLNLSPAKIIDPGLSAAALNLTAEIDKPISSPQSKCVIRVGWQSSTRYRLRPSIFNPAAAQTSRSRANRAHLHTAHSLEIYTFSLEIHASRSFANSTKVLRFAVPAARLTDISRTQCPWNPSLDYLRAGSARKKKPPPCGRGFRGKNPGDDLLSHARCTLPSAHVRFTSEFGMGSGGSIQL